jgi:Tol biopolymer transport system component
VSDIFLRDTCRKAAPGCVPSTIRVSLANDGSEPNGPSFRPSVSGDGRYVVFTSQADNLIDNDRNSSSDIFLRDTCISAAGECRPSTVLLSADNAGIQANSSSDFGKISGSGRSVTFVSAADNLIVNDTNLSEDIFVRDTCADAADPCSPSTSRASLGPNGLQADGANTMATLSADGRYVAFASNASNLVPGVKAARSEVFLRDTCAGTRELCTPRPSEYPSRIRACRAKGRACIRLSAPTDDS